MDLETRREGEHHKFVGRSISSAKGGGAVSCTGVNTTLNPLAQVARAHVIFLVWIKT